MDAPPWWHFKKKNRLYIDGFAQKGHRALMPFALIRENGPEKFRKWELDITPHRRLIKEGIDLPESLSACSKTISSTMIWNALAKSLVCGSIPIVKYSSWAGCTFCRGCFGVVFVYRQKPTPNATTSWPGSGL